MSFNKTKWISWGYFFFKIPTPSFRCARVRICGRLQKGPAVQPHVDSIFYFCRKHDCMTEPKESLRENDREPLAFSHSYAWKKWRLCPHLPPPRESWQKIITFTFFVSKNWTPPSQCCFPLFCLFLTLLLHPHSGFHHETSAAMTSRSLGDWPSSTGFGFSDQLSS